MAIKAGETKFSEQESLHSYCIGHSVSKFLPVKLGVLSINVMKFLVCREYGWIVFLPCQSFWSGIVFGLYIDVRLVQRLRIYGAFPPLFFISAWHGA